MDKLKTSINLSSHDDLYQMLVDMHENLSPEESNRINAKLIISMMNQIGDVEVIKNIFLLVRQSTEKARIEE